MECGSLDLSIPDCNTLGLRIYHKKSPIIQICRCDDVRKIVYLFCILHNLLTFVHLGEPDPVVVQPGPVLSSLKSLGFM